MEVRKEKLEVDTDVECVLTSQIAPHGESPNQRRKIEFSLLAQLYDNRDLKGQGRWFEPLVYQTGLINLFLASLEASSTSTWNACQRSRQMVNC